MAICGYNYNATPLSHFPSKEEDLERPRIKSSKTKRENAQDNSDF